MRSVLMIENDSMFASVIFDLLSDEGISMTLVGDGKTALDYLKSSPKPDLIILDLQMPVMDGQTFLERRLEEGLESIPIVVCSNSWETLPLNLQRSVIGCFEKLEFKMVVALAVKVLSRDASARGAFR